MNMFFPVLMRQQRTEAQLNHSINGTNFGNKPVLILVAKTLYYFGLNYFLQIILLLFISHEFIKINHSHDTCMSCHFHCTKHCLIVYTVIYKLEV